MWRGRQGLSKSRKQRTMLTFKGGGANWEDQLFLEKQDAAAVNLREQRQKLLAKQRERVGDGGPRVRR